MFRILTAALLCCAALSPAAAKSHKGAKTPPLSPQDEKMSWFREAKFGLFIHWGLYSIPAGEWNGQPVPGIGEWIMNRAKIPVKQYEELAVQFNPTRFNAEEWVKLAEEAGMKYVVITSKHHDGFAMYHSSASPYNIFDATPFHRDPLKELSETCARHFMRFGFYYSQAQDWHEPNGAGNTWDFGPDNAKDFDQYLRGKAEPQVRELLTGYGPVCLLWFDTPYMMTGNRGQRFIDMVHSLQPKCLIDGRLGTEGDYRSMGDNQIPNTVVAGDWEVPATLNDTWGYKKDDLHWKTPQELIFKLVDIVSKGGNYLLNVGPDSRGVIPQASQDNLRAVGRWLKVYGDAIYGARPTPLGQELGATDPEKKGPDGKPLFVAKTAWRCTAKPGKLYIHIFQWPSDPIELGNVKARVKKAYMMADPRQRPLRVWQSGGNVKVGLPQLPTSEYASVVVLETK